MKRIFLGVSLLLTLTLNAQLSENMQYSYIFEDIEKEPIDIYLVCKFYHEFLSCSTVDCMSEYLFIPYFEAKDRDDPLGRITQISPTPINMTMNAILEEMKSNSQAFNNPLAKFYFIYNNNDRIRRVTDTLNLSCAEYFF